MSSVVYGALSRKRLEETPHESVREGAPGLRTYVDSLTALIPAEALIVLQTLLPSVSERSTTEAASTVAITDTAAAQLLFWGLLVLSVAMYVAGRARSFKPGSITWPDVARALIPPTALFGWLLVEHPELTRVAGVELSNGMRTVSTAFGAAALGTIASLLGIQADNQSPAGTGHQTNPAGGTEEADEADEAERVAEKPEEDPSTVRPWYFRARPSVRWLTPKEIISGASGEFFGGLFSKFTDNRDRIDLLRRAVVHINGRCPTARAGQEIRWLTAPWDGGEAEFWLDYVADIGDGFGATYRVAELIAADGPTSNGTDLQRGELLVFGGDQVYPVADRKSYRDRAVGPYSLAFSSADDPSRRPAFAIPGNHDWYDGLSGYLAEFTIPESAIGKEASQEGPWTRCQTRSYFAAELRHGWWIWGVDMGLDTKSSVTQEQVEYFKAVAKLLKERSAGAKGIEQSVILTISEPGWIKRETYRVPRPADSWDRLVMFLSQAFDSGEDKSWTSTVRLIITGDKHYYARHESRDRRHPALITAGGGGAYLSSTLDVPATVNLNLEPLGFPGAAAPESTEFSLARNDDGEPVEWPSKVEAKRMGLQGLVRIPLLNPALIAMFSFLYGLFAFLSITGWRQPSFARPQRLVPTLDVIDTGTASEVISTTLLGSVVTAGGFAFMAFVVLAVGLHAASAAKRTGWLRGGLFGLGHLLLHLVAMTFSVVLAVRMTWNAGDLQLQWVLVALVVGVILMALPETWNKYFFRVWEPGQLLYFVPHVVVLAVLSLVGWQAPGRIQTGEAGAITAVVGAAVIGGPLGATAFTLALVAGQRAKIGLNELFVGLRHSGYKHFLRIKLTGESAHVHMVGVKRTIPRTVVTTAGRPPALVKPRSSRRQSEPMVYDEFEVPSARGSG